MDSISSYLYDAQKIPGETREEKFKHIGQIVKKISGQVNTDFDVSVSEHDVPDTLVPLIKVLVGVRTRNSAFIIEALKSDDTYLIYEALRARWFYDGSDEKLANYKFFSTNILPFISMKTRREIIKKLNVCLGNKTEIAENFFNGFVADYGVQEATNLLPACTSEFIYNAIVKYKIVLSNKLLEKLYRKYPDLALKYLKFTNPDERRDEISRTMFRLIDANEYSSFFPLLVPKHPEDFVNIQEICNNSARLKKRRAKLFLKHSKHILIQRPRDIIELMPIKLVYDSLTEEEFETMFGNVLEDRWDMFSIDDVLNYLEYYPENKRATLLRNKVKEKYGHDLFEKVEKLTPKFLLLLPAEERYALARRIVEVLHKMEDSDPETTWWCFLPTEEAIPALKTQILKYWKANKRQKLFSQLIYVCKLNKSKEALLEVLRFVDEKYQNERPDVICGMLDKISQEFDLDEFDQDYWTCMFNIIKRIKLKKGLENAREFWVLIKILKKNVHYCVENNLPADEIINLIVRLFLEGRIGVSWKLLEDEAEYERRYLDVCFKNNYWQTMNYKKNVIEGIYNFNERHVTDGSGVARLSIKDYPDLLKLVEETLRNKKNKDVSWVIYTKEKLKKHELELFNSWFPEGEEESMSLTLSDEEEMPLENDKDEEESKVPPALEEKPKEKVIYITEAIIALKRNYPEIKENWERYYNCCKRQESSKKKHYVRQFLKSLHWYQEVPVKFVEKAIQEKNYNVMGYLLDGRAFSRVARFLLPKEFEEDHYSSYLSAIHITTTMRNASSPISVELVRDFLSAHFMYSFKNYINDGLKMWSYVAYRTASDRMIELTKELSRERLFLKRHGIRLMSTMASRHELVNYFEHMWEHEHHPAVREVLAEKIGKLFSRQPSRDTWLLVRKCLDGLALSEDENLELLIGYRPVPALFASNYVGRVVGLLQSFVKQGLSKQQAAKLFDQLLDNVKPECQDYLTEDVCREVLQYYLINIDYEFSNVDRFIVKIYLNPCSPLFDLRLKYFMEILAKLSKHCYSQSPEKRKHTPNLVDSFVHTVVDQVQKFKGSRRLVKSLAEEFEKLFPPYQHAYGHVMLFLCVQYTKTQPSFKDFGKMVSEQIGVLLAKYAPEYFMHIVDLIKEFICSFSFYEYSATIRDRLNFLEGLVEDKSVHGSIIAAKLLNQKYVSEYNQQHCKILQQLSESDNPIVQSFL